MKNTRNPNRIRSSASSEGWIPERKMPFAKIPPNANSAAASSDAP